MYVIKVIDAYFTGLGLSPNQRDAKRFDTVLAAGLRDAVTLFFGADARFVRLTSRQDRIAADNLADYDSDVNLWSGDF